MATNDVEQLVSLRDAYQRLRNENLATAVTINTLAGEYVIRNPQVVSAVLDFLIKEANDQIKKANK